ncbi:hypothetical protein, partial [Flagellimonas algicola]
MAKIIFFYTKFVHCFVSIEDFFLLKEKFRYLRYILIVWCAIGSWGVSSQEVDNWYSADRAVNTASPTGQLSLFTPYAPGDGTPVFGWYELVDYFPNYTQNAWEHPNPANYDQPWQNYPSHGFEHPSMPGYLTPTGSIPGRPTLRRNVMNFNPAIEFDPAGVGDALYFRAHARDESMIFVVFSAQGSGSTAATQSLLLGGDIANHLSSITNLSLGVSDGNRFSVGRTWRSGGEFYQAGSVDLLTRPTIGTFSRSYFGSDGENLKTWVNGLPDIDVSRNDPTAQETVFYYNRVGKHFNDSDPVIGVDPSNLSGHVAEILLMDGLTDANHVRRTESYLAIKYGITLNGSGSLGSLDGNHNYDYLAADGTVIWPVDASYRYDIAGIGKDRYHDQDNVTGDGIKLRYNLHQRISKSVNAEARVTISTNSNFSTDNLDNTRTAIDARHFIPMEHNYLIWGNDHASVMVTNVELPVGTVTERISREWKVKVTKSADADPILGVSVKMELTGSDITLSDQCSLYLMIDTDGDGDFTTGTITYIEAASIVGTDVFFDNIDFGDNNVFTIGYGDFTAPTASNPSPISVCDTIPDPDVSVVLDEDDNCAVDSVTHINDISDNQTNPETITRTYRVTDTSGNFTDVTQLIMVYTSPNAGTDNVIDICVNDSSVNLFAALGVADSGGSWDDVDGTGVDLSDPTNVDFTGVSSGRYNFDYTVAPAIGSPCANDSARVTVDVIDEPSAADAGTDMEQC